MKIGVFGDSFADRRARDSWWSRLSEFGHDVTSFGEGGSSLAFSAGLLWTHASEFDYLIWCVTSVNRVSFYHDDRAYHVTNAFDQPEQDSSVARLQGISQSYLQNVFHPHGHEVLGNLAVQGALEKFSNLLIVPCFATPVYFMESPGFNLFELSTREAQWYFPGQDLYTIFHKWQDIRSCHFTHDTNHSLANMISQAINQGHTLFTSDYSNFAQPIQSLSEAFKSI